jgi:hypothetical protein
VLPFIRSLRSPIFVACLGATIAGAGACRAPAAALGGTPAAARENADEALRALEARFGPVQIDSAMVAVRMKFARGALTPSRLVNDSGAWTSMSDGARLLEIAGSQAPDGYRLGIRGGLPTPRAAGEYRRTTELRPLGEGEYEWHVRDELAVGPVRTRDLGRALTAVLGGAEQHREPTIRTAYREQLPRTTAALGRLFSLDTVRSDPRSDGAADVTIVVGIHPDRLASAFPHWSRYLEKYVSPARYRLIVFDDTGDRWWVAQGEENRVTLRLRVAGGSLVPLDGPQRRMPDALHAQVDFVAKMFLFHVGERQLMADVTLARTPDEAGFAVRFRREPEWVLPPLVARMLRTPLRRPFQGEGAMLGYSVSDGADGAATLAVRDYRIAVRESAIVRWFGKLGNTALSDFREGAEREADAFEGEFWRALRADVSALLSAE